MTHIQNIPHILKYGITHKNSSNSNPEFKEIGDSSLINTRNSRNVLISNGETDTDNCISITLGDYIPFYFDVKMPMLFVIQKGGNFVKSRTSPHDIIYLVCSLQTIIESNFIYYFSDAHATENYSTFYDKSKITSLPDILNWESIKAPAWGGQENTEIKHKKQAEFLIKNDIPTEFIKTYGCYSEATKEELLSLGIPEQKIKINSKAYFNI